MNFAEAIAFCALMVGLICFAGIMLEAHNRRLKNRERELELKVRLAEAEFYQHPLAGVMRLEMHAPEDADFVPRAVRDIADLSGTLLSKLASQPHKDGRAPQNLVPTAALEQEMSLRLGNSEMVTRRIRAHLAARSAVA